MTARRRLVPLLALVAASAFGVTVGGATPAYAQAGPGSLPEGSPEVVEPARSKGGFGSAFRADTVSCAGLPVNDIVIYTAAPTVAGTRRVPVVNDIVRTLHVTTDPDVIGRYVLLRRGDVCDELRREESERILRAQPYIAEAAVLAVADGAGGVRLEVHTVDEASLVLGVRARSSSPFATSVRLGNSNIAGAGMHASGEWRRDAFLRDGYGYKFRHHQFLRRHWVLESEGRRDPLGGDWRVEVGHPFLTDLQRTGWWTRAGDGTTFTKLEQEGLTTLAAGTRRSYRDAGMLARVGPPRRMALVGGALTWETERPDANYLLPHRAPEVVDTTGVLAGRYEAHRMARVNLLLGWRSMDYAQVRGFDALTAVQDMPIGVQVSTVVGRGVRAFGADEHDLLLGGDLYAAAGGADGAIRLAMQVEGRRQQASQWDGILTAGQLAHFARVDSLHSVITTLDWSGGWDMRVPYAFALGARDGGIRGYERARAIGARRAVLRLEDRRLLWRVRGNTGQLGWSWRTEVGRIWAGDVPLGVTSPVQAAVGLSLLAAYPAQSSRLWRLDVTHSVGHGSRYGWTVRLAKTSRSALTWREPGDVSATRERTVPANLFDWP